MRTGMARALATAALAILSWGGGSSTALAIPVQPAFDDRFVPGYPDVLADFVAIPGGQAPGAPEALNRATFLRVHSVAAGLQPNHADAVVVVMPGFASAAGLWLNTIAAMVHRAAMRPCPQDAGGRCLLEVWVVQRRGNLISDTLGMHEAKAQRNPMLALDYYYGTNILGSDASRPGKFPIAPDPTVFLGEPGAVFRPLQNADVPFYSEFGFETYAADVTAMIGLITEQGGQNIFLCGHSQGGFFTQLYAGYKLPSGQRGQDQLAGLCFLDGGDDPVSGSPTTTSLNSYIAEVTALRSGSVPLFGENIGGISLNPAAGALAGIQGLFARYQPEAESVFAPPAVESLEDAPGGMAFLSTIRLTNRAVAGATFTPNPFPNAFEQNAIIGILGSKMGVVGFAPVPGSAPCDPLDPQHRTAPPCPANVDELDPQIVYDWVDGGGYGIIAPNLFAANGLAPAAVAGDLSKSSAYVDLAGYSPSMTNVEPVTLTFPVSGTVTIDGREMTGTFYYGSERYEDDLGFLPGFATVQIAQDGINVDIDSSAITIPTYASKGPLTSASAFGNPFPGVTDFEEVNTKGEIQSPQSAALSPLPPGLSTALYAHSDHTTADDSLASVAPLGSPGTNMDAALLVDFIFARAKGTALVPTPASLGVVQTR